MSINLQQRPGAARRTLRLSPLFWLLGLGACTSVLGIEDLHDGPRPDGVGNAGSAGNDSSAGKNNTGGKDGSNGGTENNPGGMGDQAGTGNGPSGGTSGSGTVGGSGNDAGAGGADTTPTTGAVHGKVIDRWGVVVADVSVQIGAQQVSTDSQGAFTIPDVAATYDLSLLVNGSGWVYQGLTRRDPTLQVYDGHTTHSTYVEVTSSNATLGANDQLTLSIGMPTGSGTYEDIGIDSPVSLSAYWEGGTTSTSSVHGLEWTKNATTHLPVSYKAYDTKNVALVDSVDNMTTLNLQAPNPAIVSKAITGTATPFSDGYRNNSMFVRFNSGAMIQVVNDDAVAAPFSYLAPVLPNTNITFAAWEGSYYGPLGMVHKDGLAPGAATGTIKIPAPPTVLTPPNSATGVDKSTSFSFKASPDNAGAFLVILHNITLDDEQHLYIVTSQKKFTIPTVVDGAFELTPGDECEWWVETHGSFATTDEMTGPNGYIDEFSVNYTTPVAIHVADGTYTYSAAYQFTLKP